MSNNETAKGQEEEKYFSSIRQNFIPPFVIPLQKAKDMVAYHCQTVPKLSSNGDKLGNPCSVHFELGALYAYLNNLVFSQHVDGVRIYFGRYKEDEVRDDTNYKDCATVIFVGTRKSVDAYGEYPQDIVNDLVYQPYNSGISCPPLPPTSCRGAELSKKA